jgi:hypothetical protein
MARGRGPSLSHEHGGLHPGAYRGCRGSRVCRPERPRRRGGPSSGTTRVRSWPRTSSSCRRSRRERDGAAPDTHGIRRVLHALPNTSCAGQRRADLASRHAVGWADRRDPASRWAPPPIRSRGGVVGGPTCTLLHPSTAALCTAKPVVSSYAAFRERPRSPQPGFEPSRRRHGCGRPLNAARIRLGSTL